MSHEGELRELDVRIDDDGKVSWVEKSGRADVAQ